jgi:hypothetical protein
MNTIRDDEAEEDPDADSGDEIVSGDIVRDVLDHMYQNDDTVIFGAAIPGLDIHSLHPDQGSIFRLWQVYLDNVDPLLKITHTSTLQAKLIHAASKLSTVEPAFEALMFGIYCVAVMSLDTEKCSTMFSTPRADLLRGYQFGCQQALLKCGVFRSIERDSLTAFFFYLVCLEQRGRIRPHHCADHDQLSTRPDTDPRTLSTMLGMCVRLAQRMHCHEEPENAKCNALEAELRRRLWWALIIFDNRISEMSNSRSTMLMPIWDCQTPHNVSDFDLRSETSTAPPDREMPTEALFVVVRSEMDDWVRNCAFQLDFVNPAMRAIVRDIHNGTTPESELTALIENIESKYLRHCSEDNPIQYMTILTARDFLAKHQLLEHYSKYIMGHLEPTDELRETAINHALTILACDTTLTMSPLTKGFSWFTRIYFPLPAYIHLVQVLRKQPMGDSADRAWQAMSDNYEARFEKMPEVSIFLRVVSKPLLEAWSAREAALREHGRFELPPRCVTHIQEKVIELAMAKMEGIKLDRTETTSTDYSTNDAFQDMGGFGAPISADGGSGQAPWAAVHDFSTLAQQSPHSFDSSQLQWAFDWNQM